MIPKNLELENFMCYGPQATTLDFTGIDLACLAGENGHGKSALIDAITWALWGKARARRDDELIHLGQEYMRVEFDFELDGVDYRILRQRKSGGRGSSALEFQAIHNGQARPLTGDSLKETQQKIIDTIRMDHETFINSALLLQGRADEFTNQRPGERKRILGEILGLARYDALEQRAKERAKAAELNLEKARAGAAQIQEELDRKPDYEASLAQAELATSRIDEDLSLAQRKLRQLQDKTTELSLKRQGLNDIENELDSKRREIEELRRRILAVDAEKLKAARADLESVRVRLAGLGDLDVDKDTHQKELQRLSSERASLGATNKQLKADMETLAEEIELLKEAEAQCPLCDSELTEEHREEILAGKEESGKTKATIYRRNAEKKAELTRKVNQLGQDIREVNSRLAQAKDLRDREMTISKVLAELESQQARVAEWTEQADGLERTLEELSQRKENLSLELESLKEEARALDDQRRVVDRLDVEASQAKVRLGAVQQKLDHCTYLEGEKEKRIAEHDEAARSKALFDALRLAFGKKGIQAMIIETIIPELEEEANRLLEQMTDGRMHVEFNSQRETQKGTLMETLDIEVSDELGSRDYGLFSGGEAFRINFAIRIAISKLLARRAGARLQTLIIDEGFGSQDGHGRDRLVEAINSVRKDFGLVLVITHIEELKEAFANRIEVVKGPAGSMVSVN